MPRAAPRTRGARLTIAAKRRVRSPPRRDESPVQLSWLPPWSGELRGRQSDPLTHLGRKQHADDVRLANDVRPRVVAEVVRRLPGHHVGVAIEIVESRYGPPEPELMCESRGSLELEH